MRDKEIIGDAMQECQNERIEAWEDSPHIEMTDSDLDDWAEKWSKRDCPILGKDRYTGE